MKKAMLADEVPYSTPNSVAARLGKPNGVSFRQPLQDRVLSNLWQFCESLQKRLPFSIIAGS